MNVREIVALFFMEIKLVALTMIVPMILAIAVFAHAPKRYEATAKILVTGQEVQSPTALPPSSDAGPQSTSQEVLNSEVEFLTSRELADRTIQAVGPSVLFPRLPTKGGVRAPDPDALSQAFAKALKVRAVASSHVIDVSLEGPTAKVTTQALATYLLLYQELHKQAYSSPVAGLLHQQLQGYEQSLQNVEANIAEFKEKNSLFDTELERKNLLDTKNSLYATAIQLRNQAAEQIARGRALQGLREKTPDQISLYPEAAESDAMQHARAQLLELKQQQTKLSENYQPASRAMRDVQTQIDAVQAFLATETQRFAGQTRPGRNPIYDELSLEIARASTQIAPDRGRAAAIDAQIAGVDRRLNQISEAEKTLEPLQRQRAEDIVTIEAFRQREAEAKLGEYLDKQKIANVRVIQGAEPTTINKPIAPKLFTYVAGGLAGGLILTAMLLGALFAKKNTFLVPETVEARTNIPVLVSLPVRAA